MRASAPTRWHRGWCVGRRRCFHTQGLVGSYRLGRLSSWHSRRAVGADARAGTYFRLLRIRCTMQVCTVVCGNTASIASGNPFRPSTQQIRMSETPRWRQFGEDLHPELRALRFLKPHAQHVARSVQADAHRQVTRASLHASALADLQHQRVQEDDWVDVIQRALLPRASVVHHRVGHPADQIPADVHAVDLGEVRLDIPRRQPAGIQREDLVVKACECYGPVRHAVVDHAG